MTVEYVLLLVALMAGLKIMISAPSTAFKEAGPMLAARVEQQLATGDGFLIKGNHNSWVAK